jgi:hypothetical protein
VKVIDKDSLVACKSFKKVAENRTCNRIGLESLVDLYNRPLDSLRGCCTSQYTQRRPHYQRGVINGREAFGEIAGACALQMN